MTGGGDKGYFVGCNEQPHHQMLLNLTHWTFNVSSDKDEFHHSHVSYCTKVTRSTHRRVWATEPGLIWMSAAGSVIGTVIIVVTMDD